MSTVEWKIGKRTKTDKGKISKYECKNQVICKKLSLCLEKVSIKMVREQEQMTLKSAEIVNLIKF